MSAPTSDNNDGESVRFLKSKGLLRKWEECEGQVYKRKAGHLSMDRPPPALHREAKKVQAALAPPPPPSPPRACAVKKPTHMENFVRLVEKYQDFREWLDTPEALKLPISKAAAEAQAEDAAMKLATFDLQDIPRAMEKLFMPKSAQLQRRWFEGYENYSLSDDDLRDELDQNGKSYEEAMIDDDTIQMDWILKFPRSQKALDDLIGNIIRNEKSIDLLRKILTPYRSRVDINAWRECKSNIREFHRLFQFQYVSANSSWGQQIGNFLNRMVTAGGVPDDLTGALGSFNIYAAVHSATFDWTYSAAIVREIAVYVRDPYDFTNAQYLGHWNSRRVAVVPAHQLSSSRSWLEYPICQGKGYGKDALLYAVTNKDYRDWRTRHKQGGDFIIYTDRMIIRLDPPIYVYL